MTRIEGPVVVVKAASKRDGASIQIAAPSEASAVPEPDRASRKSAIVTARRQGAKDVPDPKPEEHQRRCDAADALFRKVTGKDRP